jgi:hypothetical protein
MHIRCGKSRSGGNASGFYPIAKYKFREPQPTDAEMRTTEAWHAWCAGQPEAKERGIA